MIGTRGVDPFGITVPLLNAGYEVHLLTQRRRMIDYDLWRSRRQEYGLTPEDEELAVFGVAENKRRAAIRGLTVAYGRLTVDRVAQYFNEGFIPLVLVHMGVVHQLDIPHWVVVTDIRDYHVFFNDPYPPKGGKNIRVSWEEFQQMISNVGTRIGLSPSVVFIRRRKSMKKMDTASPKR